jgi:bZIP transcription factor
MEDASSTDNEFLDTQTKGSKQSAAFTKRQERLEKNRESARQSRRRKKEYLKMLEQQSLDLTKELINVRHQHCLKCASSLNKLESLSSVARNQLDVTLLSPQELQAIEKDFALQLEDRFGPVCRERLAVIDYQLEELRQLILSPEKKFLLWLIHQKKEFFHIGNPGSASADISSAPFRLWPQLCKEIGLSMEQSSHVSSKILDLRSNCESLPQTALQIGIIVSFLDKLSSEIRNGVATYESISSRLQEILSPKQALALYDKMQTENVAIPSFLRD